MKRSLGQEEPWLERCGAILLRLGEVRSQGTAFRRGTENLGLTLVLCRIHVLK